MADQMPDNAWGHPDRYYTAVGTPRRDDTEVYTHTWQGALEQAHPGVRDTVFRTYKQWNNILRDYLRTETALRLTVGDQSQAVPVRVVNGMPPPLTAVMRQYEGLEWLLLNRPLIEATVAGTGIMQIHQPSARSRWGAKAGPATQTEIQRVQETAQAWLDQLDASKAIDEMLGIKEDILGAYYFHIPEVHLYWLAIGITALALGVSPEALTIVVLAHELAHAYTHLGRDIDNQKWETPDFAETELDIVEGLAQFYTEVICKRLKDRMPDALTAFETLLEKQSTPYMAHQGWVEDKEAAGEIIRVSMIQCRSRKIKIAEKFTSVISQHRTHVRGKETQGTSSNLLSP